MAFKEDPWSVLVEDFFVVTRDLDEYLPAPQRDKMHKLRNDFSTQYANHTLARTIERVGWTAYTERKARELGLTRKAS